MGRSRGGLIVAPSHIKMNKLLLALAIGLSLLTLAAGSSSEENQVERFESGLAREAREADPAKRQRKNQAKKKNQRDLSQALPGRQERQIQPRDQGRTRPRKRTWPRGRTSPRRRTRPKGRTKTRGRTRRATRRESLTRGRG